MKTNAFSQIPASAVRFTGWMFVLVSTAFLASTIPSTSGNNTLFTEGSNCSSPFVTNTTFTTGSAIISMGETPQTFDNALEPYALIHALVQANCPVSWVINQSKLLYGDDFTVASTDFGGTPYSPDKTYKGSAFIIKKELIDAIPAVAGILSTWDAEGVAIDFTTEPLTAFVHGEITSFPKVLINDESQDELIDQFFANSKVPASVYDVGPPQDLGLDCYDMFAAPHADPHSNWEVTPDNDALELLDFVNAGGYVWAGCHAVSALETYTNSTGSGMCFSDLNFLSNGGLVPWSDQNGCGYTAHVNDNSAEYNGPAFTYNGDGPSLSSSPFFQYTMDHDDVYRGGSEKIYMAFNDATAHGGSGGWRSTTQIFIEDSDHFSQYPADAALSEGKAAICAVGPAFGDTNKGTVLYQASHTLDDGTEAENAQAQRIFGNFMLESGFSQGVQIPTSTIPATLLVAQANNFSVTASGGTAPYTYSWTASCAGTFSAAAAASTTFTPSATGPNCIITCVITDVCGRTNFVSQSSNVECAPNQVILQVSQN